MSAEEKTPEIDLFDKYEIYKGISYGISDEIEYNTSLSEIIPKLHPLMKATDTNHWEIMCEWLKISLPMLYKRIYLDLYIEQSTVQFIGEALKFEFLHGYLHWQDHYKAVTADEQDKQIKKMINRYYTNSISGIND